MRFFVTLLFFFAALLIEVPGQLAPVAPVPVPGELPPVAPVPVPGELPSVPELPELPDVDLADYLDAINQLEANNELLARIIDDLLATLLPRVVDSTNVKRVVELLNNLRNLITYVIEKLRVYDLVPSQNLIALINALNLVLDVVLPLLPILLPPIGQSAQAPPPSDKPLDQLVDCIFTSVAYILDIVLPIIGAIIDKLNAYLAQIVPERQGTLNDLGKSLTAIASDAATLTGTVTDIVNTKPELACGNDEAAAILSDLVNKLPEAPISPPIAL